MHYNHSPPKILLIALLPLLYLPLLMLIGQTALMLWFLCLSILTSFHQCQEMGYCHLFSTEVKYKSIVHGIAKAYWSLTTIFYKLGICLASPPMIFCDNILATYLAANMVFLASIKHIVLEFHFVREDCYHESSVFAVSAVDQCTLEEFICISCPATNHDSVLTSDLKYAQCVKPCHHVISSPT